MPVHDRSRWMPGLARTSRLLCVYLWLCASSAAAQGVEPGEVSPEVSPEYSQLVAQAVSEFDAGRFLESRALLQRAHELSPNARTLRGMGLAAFEAGRHALAVGDLQRALAEHRQPLSEPQREEARLLLIEADAATARYRLLDRPWGAALEVDGEPAVIDQQGFLVVDPGQHTLVVRAGEAEPYSHAIEAAAGQHTAISLRPDPKPTPDPELPPAFAEAPPVLPATVALQSSPPEPAETSGLSVQRTFAYAAFAGAAIAGGLTVWQWMERESAVDAWNEDACLERGRTRQANCSQHQQAYEQAETLAWAMGITTVALSAGGVTLLLLEPDSTEARPESARCALGISAVQCRVMF